MESWRARVEGHRLERRATPAALSPVLSRKLLEIRNLTLTDFLGPSGSTVSDSCLQEFAPEGKLHGSSHVFPECLPSGLPRCSSFIYLAVLGLRCCAWAPSRCREQGPCWLPCVGFSAWWPLSLQSSGSAGSSVAAARGLSRRGSWTLEHRPSSGGAQAQELRCTWDRLGSGIEPAPPAWTGRLTHRTAREVLPFGLPAADTYGMPPICQVFFRRQVPP